MASLQQESLLSASLRRAALSSVNRARAQINLDEKETVTEEIGLALEEAAFRPDTITISGTAARGASQPREPGASYGEPTERIEKQYEVGAITKGEKEARIRAARTPALEAVALAINPEDFVRESRKRVRRVFTFLLV